MTTAKPYTQSIANDINAIADGSMFVCEDCGELIRWDQARIAAEDGESVPYCPNCDSELTQAGMRDYFTDVFNIEYRVSSRHDEDLNSVAVCVATGGPEVWVDTKDRKVKKWTWFGAEYEESEISSDACDQILEMFEEIWRSE